MCQKAVGGPFITLVQLRPGQIAWTRGTPGEFRSSTIATRLFCRDCGTPLAYVDDDTGALEVTSGSLDDPRARCRREPPAPKPCCTGSAG